VVITDGEQAARLRQTLVLYMIKDMTPTTKKATQVLLRTRASFVHTVIKGEVGMGMRCHRYTAPFPCYGGLGEQKGFV
jgi:hypothetical protein